jgi:hypothetical protein
LVAESRVASTRDARFAAAHCSATDVVVTAIAARTGYASTK